jgi:phosphoglycerate dehydrogenase-like enzyme
VPIRETLASVIVTNASGIHGTLVADYVYAALVMLQFRFPRLWRRGPAFGLRVLGLRRQPAPVEGVSRVLGPDGLPELLRESDAVVLSVPETGETRGLLGAKELRAMKPGAFVINVARGAVVDEAALLDVLREGRLGGAALDVFATEPLPAASPLWDLPNVIVTPHIAGEPAGYTERVISEVFADNVARYRAGQPLRNVVDLARGVLRARRPVAGRATMPA